MRAQMPIKEGFFLGGESDFLSIHRLNHVAMILNRTYFLAVWNEKIDARQRNEILIPEFRTF
jgi:hypothetical protein